MTVNSGKSAKKPRGKGKPFQPSKFEDPPINIKVAPFRRKSFQETINRQSVISNEQLADYFGRETLLGKQFLTLPPVVPIRDVLIGRALLALANDFDARGFEKLTDRGEGKPNQPISGRIGVYEVDLEDDGSNEGQD